MEVIDAEYQWYVIDVVHDSFFDDDLKKGIDENWRSTSLLRNE